MENKTGYRRKYRWQQLLRMGDECSPSWGIIQTHRQKEHTRTLTNRHDDGTRLAWPMP
jgi:hypothetical protein